MINQLLPVPVPVPVTRKHFFKILKTFRSRHSEKYQKILKKCLLCTTCMALGDSPSLKEYFSGDGDTHLICFNYTIV